MLLPFLYIRDFCGLTLVVSCQQQSLLSLPANLVSSVGWDSLQLFFSELSQLMRTKFLAVKQEQRAERH